MFKIFMEGGLGPMSILTILFVALFFAAWKAPQWVKEIGLLALAFGILWRLIGFMQMFSAFYAVSSGQEGITGIFDLVSPGVLFKGLQVNTISLIYGIIIYMVSLVIRIIQKPKI